MVSRECRWGRRDLVWSDPRVMDTLRGPLERIGCLPLIEGWLEGIPLHEAAARSGMGRQKGTQQFRRLTIGAEWSARWILLPRWCKVAILARVAMPGCAAASQVKHAGWPSSRRV